MSAALGGSGRSNSVKIARTCATVTAGVFPPQAQSLALQKPQRQQRQRHMMMPADPTAYLIMVQTDLAIALREEFLDLVPCAMHLGDLAAPRVVRVA